MSKKLPFFGLFSILAIGFILKINLVESKIPNEKIRQNHTEFRKNHPYNKLMALTKTERKRQGLPPNAYFEQEYLNEMNPYTGKTNKLELFELQKKLNLERVFRKVPGDDLNNPWIERGPNNVGGRTRAVIFDPNDASHETVFAGGVSGGLWKNTNISNALSEWTQVGVPENLAVSCIAIDPNNSNVWYLGTGESYVSGDVNGNGVWKTTNGGATWTNVILGVNGNSIFESNAKITVNSPVSISGNYSANLSTTFGGNLNTNITGNLVLVNDGVSPTDDGCSAITKATSINGKIAVIRRGNCPFVIKAKNAQNSGAIAVIIVNNEKGNAIGMSGDDATITIPTLMVSQSDGNKLINSLSEEVNVVLSNSENTSGFNVLNGIQHVNDIIVRNNGGVSEVFVAAGESFYSDASPSTLLGFNDIGVYKSLDGTNFSKLTIPKNASGGNFEPNNLEIAADNSIYLSTIQDSFGNGGGAILKSTNGTDFSLAYQVPGGRRVEIVCSKSDPNLIYILSQLASSPVGIYKTEDGFVSVSAISLPNDVDTGIPSNDFARGQAGYNLLLAIDPNDDKTIYVGGIDLFKSNNGGADWTQISKWSNNNNLRDLEVSLVHADQHGLAFSSSSRMIFGNDGGVYFSSDAGSTISSRNLGYNTLQFYTLGVAPITAFNGDYFLAGAQDNGTQLFENSATGVDGTVDVSGGDGAASFFDQDGIDKYFIVNYVYNKAIRLYDFNTSEYRTINEEDESNGDFINTAELDSNLDMLFTNYSSQEAYMIKRYSNIKSGIVTGVNLTNALMDDAPSALKISPFTSNASNLFVGLKNGKVLLVKRANTLNLNSWSEITGKDFYGTVSDISFGENENQIFVTMHNYGVENIWYTIDGGITWESKEGDLPDIPVKAILQNPLNRKEVIIGTELGIWRTNDITATKPKWIQSYNGMSNVKVTDLDLRDDNTIFASTYGRGVFSGQFTSAVASVDNFLAAKKTFTVYPTISKGNFTLQTESNLGKTKMNIFDVSGKRVYKKEIDFSLNRKQEISVNLNPGIYIVNLIDENNIKSSNKIIVE